MIFCGIITLTGIFLMAGDRSLNFGFHTERTDLQTHLCFQLAFFIVDFRLSFRRFYFHIEGNIYQIDRQRRNFDHRQKRDIHFHFFRSGTIAVIAVSAAGKAEPYGTYDLFIAFLNQADLFNKASRCAGQHRLCVTGSLQRTADQRLHWQTAEFFRHFY